MAWDREEGRLLSSAFAANAMAYIPVTVLPWLIEGLAKGVNWGLQTAGLIASGELFILAMGAMVGVLLAGRVTKRAMAITGGSAALCSSLALSVSTSAPLDLWLLAGMGFGCGLCSACGNSIVAQARNPGRFTADLWFLILIWQAVLCLTTPNAFGRWHISGVYWVQTLGCLILMPLLIAWNPAVSRPSSASSNLPRLKIPTISTSALLVGVVSLCFWLRDSITWSMAERRAVVLGISDGQLSLTLAAAMTLGLAGPIVSRYLGLRFGHAKTVFGSLALLALVMQGIALSDSAHAYIFSLLFWTATSFFAWIYVLGMAVSLDAEGSLASICGGLVFLASAAGPLVGAALLDYDGGRILSLAIVILSVLTLIAGTSVARRLSRQPSYDRLIS
jgi:hypothetical protein